MDIHFSPMQGYVDNAYRQLHNEIYGGIDYYYTPFIRIEKGEPRRQDISRLDSALDDGTPLIPQIIFGSVDEFNTLVQAVKSRGYRRIDLNLGCPYPMQTRKGRGVSMIGNLDTMSDIADIINGDTDIQYSVKMRLGNVDPTECEALIDILNQCKLAHVTVHPRIARQMYDGELYKDEFTRLVTMSKNPLIWNGDLHTIDDIDGIVKEYPAIVGVMIGRGLLARPSLAAEWRDGKKWDKARRVNTVLSMHNRLLAVYEDTLCGAAQILQKIKPYWEYLEPEIGHKAYKAIHKAATLDKYRAAVDKIIVDE